MNEYDLAHLITQPGPISQITIPPIDNEEAREVLRLHGCRIEEHPQQCIIYFPTGTTRIEIFLRHIHPRYRIILPDGYELRQTYDRYQNVNLLFYPSEQQETIDDPT